MKELKLLLYPLALIYGCIVWLRNKCYDLGLFKSYSIPFPSIVVGNLSVGGTGKTPHVVMLIEHFLGQNKKVITLSRGYGRTTKGVVVASDTSTAKDIGDEPLMYKVRFGDKIQVVVAEERVKGVQHIQEHFECDVLILDDAFQHRAVTARINLLITEYNNPFFKDHVLPAGMLREFRSGAKRADIVIASKCPELTIEEQQRFKQSIKSVSNVFFSHIEYGHLISCNEAEMPSFKNILLVTGIGNPSPLIEHLSSIGKVEHLKFADHHVYSEEDIKKIHEKFDTFASHDKIIITTEKDYMRIKEFDLIKNSEIPWFYQAIETKLNEQTLFKLIDDYVNKDQRGL